MAVAGPSKLSYDEMVAEELPLQRASLKMEWPEGVPTCGGLFMRYVNCMRARSQFDAYHQYGELRTCQPKSDDWKFCLTLRSEADEDKHEEWARRRAEWFARRRQGPSAEDVFEIRRYPDLTDKT